VGASDATDYLRDQRTVNNAVGKVVERVQAAPGQVERLTVAVVVDAKEAGTADPNQVQQLVANAVGLDPQRGDPVQVDKIPFDTTTDEAAAKEIAAAEAAAKTQGYIALGTKAGLVLLALVVGFVAFRRRAKGTSVDATAMDLPPGFPRQLLQGSGQLPALESAGLGRLTAAQAGAALLSPDDVARERERMREQVAQLVDNQPDDVAAMIQGWLAERNV
jgi:flagellar M-ring protein FliF